MISKKLLWNSKVMQLKFEAALIAYLLARIFSEKGPNTLLGQGYCFGITYLVLIFLFNLRFSLF